MVNLLSSAWVITAPIIRPAIDLYKTQWLFRRAVKVLLTWNPDQRCPCWILHWTNRTCSSVISRVVRNKPQHLPMALVVQSRRCRDSANTLLSISQDACSDEQCDSACPSDDQCNRECNRECNNTQCNNDNAMCVTCSCSYGLCCLWPMCMS